VIRREKDYGLKLQAMCYSAVLGERRAFSGEWIPPD